MKTLVNKSNNLTVLHNISIANFRHDEGLHLEGKEAQLLSHLFHAAN